MLFLLNSHIILLLKIYEHSIFITIQYDSTKKTYQLFIYASKKVLVLKQCLIYKFQSNITSDANLRTFNINFTTISFCLCELGGHSSEFPIRFLRFLVPDNGAGSWRSSLTSNFFDISSFFDSFFCGESHRISEVDFCYRRGQITMLIDARKPTELCVCGARFCSFFGSDTGF